MERLQAVYELSAEQQRWKKKQVEALLKHPIVMKWRKYNVVDDAFIFDHSGKFQDLCDVKETCEQCAGLAFCRQPMKGQYLDLKLDGMLLNIVVPCSYAVEKTKQYEHVKQYRIADLPEPYLLVNLPKLDLQKESIEYKGAVMQILQCIMDENSEKGLYLWGKPGAGKSWLAAGICNYFAQKRVRVAFVNVPKLMSDLKMMFHDPDAMEQRLTTIKRAEVVVLDDIGGESITAWSRDDILLPLLDARMEKRRLTIFTSNYNQEELKAKMSVTNNRQQEPMAAQRLAERIKTLSKETFIKGESRRQ